MIEEHRLVQTGLKPLIDGDTVDEKVGGGQMGLSDRLSVGDTEGNGRTDVNDRLSVVGTEGNGRTDVSDRLSVGDTNGIGHIDMIDRLSVGDTDEIGQIDATLRNAEIYRKHQEGYFQSQLAREYSLSPEWIRRICEDEARKRERARGWQIDRYGHMPDAGVGTHNGKGMHEGVSAHDGTVGNGGVGVHNGVTVHNGTVGNGGIGAHDTVAADNNITVYGFCRLCIQTENRIKIRDLKAGAEIIVFVGSLCEAMQSAYTNTVIESFDWEDDNITLNILTK